MGINFNDLLRNLGNVSAKITNDGAHDNTKIDSKAELNSYVSGWDAIKAKADKQNADAKVNNKSAETVDVASLESDMKSELASLMGAEFKSQAKVETKTNNDGKAVFANDENVLEEMMSVLAKETDGVDLKALREYNKKGIGFAEDIDAPEVLAAAGFEPEMVNVLLDEMPGALVHIKHSIQNNTPKRFEQMYLNAQDLAQASFSNPWEAAYVMSKDNEFEPAFA